MGRPRAPWTLSRDEVFRRYRAGESAIDLARECGLYSYAPIVRELREAGIPIRPRGAPPGRIPAHIAAKMLHLDSDQVRALRAEGLSTGEIGQRLGCSAESIRRLMVEHSIERLEGKARTDRNAFWQGGYHVDSQGYILVRQPEHPQANRAGYVRSHRLVMEAKVGRPLSRREVVDHEDGDTSHNDPSNLRLYPDNAAHLRATLTGCAKLAPVEREALRREAVRRARLRVDAILAASRTGDDQLPSWWPRPSTAPRTSQPAP